MRTTLVIAALLFLQAPTTPLLDTAHFKSMREVHVGDTQRKIACAILPPAIFHEAAPALRDLRLTANGQEVPFAQEESYDQRSLATGITDATDRSYFDVVAEKTTAARDTSQTAQFHLPARIPVERVSLGQPAAHDLLIQITARISSHPQLAERISGTIHAGESSFPVTIGANLQEDADVDITLPQASAPLQVRLEMRRRWICFQPLQANAQLRIHYGDPTLPAPSYRFATSFHMPENPVIATFGPREDETLPARHPSPRRKWLLISLGALILFLPLVAMALVASRFRKR